MDDAQKQLILQQVTKFVKKLVKRIRRRRRRNFKHYRQKYIANLQTALFHHPCWHTLGKNLFPELSFENDLSTSTDLDEKSEDPAETIPTNCPIRTPDDKLLPIDGMFYFHIKSKTHLSKKILQHEKAAEIVANQCLHYSRACKVALVNYSIQDDHLHLLIAVPTYIYREARDLASKMIGCIKQQFTKRFKLWHDTIYRRERRYRIDRLAKGTLWDGRADIEFIANEQELLSCVLYIESNHVKIQAAAQIQTLENPPVLSTYTAPYIGTEYQAILDTFTNHRFQSGGWYAGGQKGHSTMLSDGTDGIWLTGADLEYWWKKSVKSYPPGWRKVWFKKGGGILIVTPDAQRRYPKNPALDLLGTTPAERGHALQNLVLATCWHTRSNVWVGKRSSTQQEPGMNEQ